MSSIKNPLAAILDSNKFTDLNYQDWLRNLNIVLATEKLLYTIEKIPPKEAPADISSEELTTLKQWWDDELKTRCFVMASMSNEMQRRFEKTKYAADIFFHLKELDAGIDQLNFHSVQLGYLKLLQMGNTDPNNKSRKRKYELDQSINWQLKSSLYTTHSQSAGGNHRSVIIGARQPITARWRHSNPVVTTPTIALDFSGTTQESASHNVAPNQISSWLKSRTRDFLEAQICYSIANNLAQFNCPKR
ncbi:hypothetical protein F511_12032 [Dorcoceras hygrometricum]|uniref:Uncharacterized protein n=1 Tax=Dorcoceras hygrometricum TaxID=472368 RepID=A0A2Z7CZ96_9LAMI|nr:hypothetical protein F511_12032 [Dorcoceras hygrometricum]